MLGNNLIHRATLKFGIKVYTHPKSKRSFFYMTINDIQVFNVYFSEREVLEAIDRIQAGGKP